MGAIKQESSLGDLYPTTNKALSAARLNHYKGLLLRRWWVIATGLLAGWLVSGFLGWTQPPRFVSVGRMIVSIKLAIPEGSVYSEELGNFLGTQAALMRCGVVLNRAQARVVAREAGPVFLPPELKVAVSPKTSIFVLEASGPDSKCVQAFLQFCMEEYINLKKEMRTQTSDTTVAGLTGEVLRLEKDLRAIEAELAAFQRSNSVVLLPDQGNSMGSYVATLNQRLAALKADEALLLSLAPGETATPVGGASSSETSLLAVGAGVRLLPLPDPPDPEAVKARQQVLLLKAEQQDLAHYLRPQHPRMIAMSEDIARRETLLEILDRQSVGDIENRKKSIGRQMIYLQQSLDEWNARALDSSQKSAEFQRLKNNEQRTQALYDRLLATLQTLDVNRDISPESVTILEPASVPTPEPRGTLKHFLSATLLALTLSIAALLFLDRVDDRINSLTEAQQCFEEPVLAQVPKQKRPGRGKQLDLLLSPEDTRHAFVEAYRCIRSTLLFQTGSNCTTPRILLLTSSVPSEGKSLTAANLAIVLASANSRVLLVDADLRKGVLHERFGLSAAKAGLSEALSGRCSWELAVAPTRYPGLSLLPRGTPTLASGELFLGEPTQRFLAQASGQFDFVILDSPPVLAADDVTSLAPRADAVLFLLRAGHTSARVGRAALGMLYRRRVNVLGLVLNDVSPGNADYYSYSRYSRDYSSPGKSQGAS